MFIKQNIAGLRVKDFTTHIARSENETVFTMQSKSFKFAGAMLDCVVKVGQKCLFSKSNCIANEYLISLLFLFS